MRCVLKTCDREAPIWEYDSLKAVGGIGWGGWRPAPTHSPKIPLAMTLCWISLEPP
jgi:hypothetical protein